VSLAQPSGARLLPSTRDTPAPHDVPGAMQTVATHLGVQETRLKYTEVGASAPARFLHAWGSPRLVNRRRSLLPVVRALVRHAPRYAHVDGSAPLPCALLTAMESFLRPLLGRHCCPRTAACFTCLSSEARCIQRPVRSATGTAKRAGDTTALPKATMLVLYVLVRYLLACTGGGPLQKNPAAGQLTAAITWVRTEEGAGSRLLRSDGWESSGAACVQDGEQTCQLFASPSTQSTAGSRPHIHSSWEPSVCCPRRRGCMH
jgi:hypothetical protein